MVDLAVIAARLNSTEKRACARLASKQISWPVKQVDLILRLSGVVDEAGSETALNTVKFIDALVAAGVLNRWSDLDWIEPCVNLTQLCAEFDKTTVKAETAALGPQTPTRPRTAAKKPYSTFRELPIGYNIVMAALLYARGDSIADVCRAVANWIAMRGFSDNPSMERISSIILVLQNKKWVDDNGILTKKGKVIASALQGRLFSQ